MPSMKQIEKQVQKITASAVAQAMTKNPATVQPNTAIEEVAALMVDKNFHTTPVMDEVKLAGIVGKEDILRTLMCGFFLEENLIMMSVLLQMEESI